MERTRRRRDREDGEMVERKEIQGGEEMVEKEEEKMRKGRCEGEEEEGDRTVGECIWGGGGRGWEEEGGRKVEGKEGRRRERPGGLPPH